MSFAENLKNYRLLKGLSRKQIAEHLNMTEAAYGFYEQGRTKPDTDKLVIIAELLSVSTDKLLDFHLNNFEHYKVFWGGAGYSVNLKDNNQVYITKNPPSTFELLEKLGLSNAKDKFKQRQILMENIKGITFESKEEFISFSQEIESESFSDTLIIYKTITDNAFLYKALEESNSRYENASYLGIENQ